MRVKFFILFAVFALPMLCEAQKPQPNSPPVHEQDQRGQKKDSGADPKESAMSCPARVTQFVTECAQKDATQNTDKNWWDRWSEDPINVLTALIAVGTFWLGWLARGQARDARENAAITARPFVFVKSTNVRIMTGENGEVDSLLFSIIWENSGDTPTRRLKSVVHFRSTPEQLTDDFDFPDDNVEITPSLIGPRATITSAPEIQFAADLIRPVVAGDNFFYAWGWAEYNDPFRKTKRHRTEFCYRYFINGDFADPASFSVTWMLHKQHNAADDDCLQPLRTRA